MNIKIKEGTIEEALDLLNLIPELNKNLTYSDVSERIYDKDFLIHIAYLNHKPAGFKIGYDRYGDGSFFSWLGGIVPEARNNSLAKLLMKRQHSWAKDKGYKSVRMTTRNKFKNMLVLALKEGFNIIGFEQLENVAENKILLQKILIRDSEL